MTKSLSRSTPLRRGVTLVAAGSLAAALAIAAGGIANASSGSSKLVSVPQGASAAAVQSASPTGTTAASTPVRISVILKAQNLSTLESKVVNGFPQPYLTTDQFAATYGQPQSVINQIEAYLSSYGLTSTALPDGLDIQATGTAGQVDKALHVTLHNYRVKQSPATVGGKSYMRTVYGTKDDPQVPSGVASDVLAILGLSNYSPFQSQALGAKPQQAAAKPAQGSGIPPGFGLSPFNYVSRYNLAPLEKSGATGQGTTLGIVTLASMNASTAFGFWNDVLGLNEPQSRLQLVPVDGGAGPVSGQAGSDETDLDVEQSGTIAPSADVHVYEAPNTDPGFADAFFTEASDNIADTASVSWGESETIIAALIAQKKEAQAYAQVFDEAYLEMGAQGISNFTATADAGAYTATEDAGTTNLSLSNPSDSPYTTAAGGTTLPGVQTYGVDDSSGNPVGTESVNIPKEISWGWDYLWPLYQALGFPDETSAATGIIGGSNGGYSVIEPRPVYQTNVTQYDSREFLIPTDPQPIAPGISEPTQWAFNPSPELNPQTEGVGRATPDVSANADPQTGYAVYDPDIFTGGWAQYGGVSFVAPQLNGSNADFVSAIGHRIGFWNPVIYKLATGGHSPFTPIDDHTVYSGPSYLWQTDNEGNVTPLPGEFTSTNLYYTGKTGTTWNPASGLGTPNLAELESDFQ